MFADRPRITDLLPPTADLTARLGEVLREAEILRGLLRLSRQRDNWQRLGLERHHGEEAHRDG